jgi:hypothetical protein
MLASQAIYLLVNDSTGAIPSVVFEFVKEMKHSFIYFEIKKQECMLNLFTVL